MNTEKIYNYNPDETKKNKMHAILIIATLTVNLIIFIFAKKQLDLFTSLSVILITSAISLYGMVIYYLKKKIISTIKENNSKENILLIHGWAGRSVLYSVISHLYFFIDTYNIYSLILLAIGSFIISGIYYYAIIHLFCEFPILKKASLK